MPANANVFFILRSGKNGLTGTADIRMMSSKFVLNNIKIKYVLKIEIKNIVTL